MRLRKSRSAAASGKACRVLLTATSLWETSNRAWARGNPSCHQQINWSSPSGKLLEEAIVLNEDEQIFGLSKAVLQLQTHRVLLNSIFPSVSFLMVYTMGHFLNLRLDLFARHGSVSVSMMVTRKVL